MPQPDKKQIPISYNNIWPKMIKKGTKFTVSLSIWEEKS